MPATPIIPKPRAAFKGSGLDTTLGATFTAMNFASMGVSMAGVPLLGAVLGMGATVGQTGQAFANEGWKAALKAFITGSVFSLIAAIPFIGAGAKAAQEAELLAKGSTTLAEAGFFGKIWNTLTLPFKATGKGIASVLGKSETLTNAWGGVKNMEAGLTARLGAVSAESRIAKMAAAMEKTGRRKFFFQMAAPMAVTMAAGAVIGDDKPAPSIAEEPRRPPRGGNWQGYVAERARAADLSPADLAHRVPHH